DHMNWQQFKKAFPEQAHKLVLLGPFGREDAPTIADPYARPLPEVQATMSTIRAAVEGLMAQIPRISLRPASRALGAGAEKVRGRLMRARLKYLLAETLYRSGVFAVLLRRKAQSGQWCVLGLHRILPAEMRAMVSSPPPMIMTTGVFDDMLAFLRREFHIVAAGQQSANTAKPAIVITIDDGWADNFQFGLPLLREHQTPASLFVVTGMIGTDQTFWIEQLYAASQAQKDAVRDRLKMNAAPLP